MTSQTQLPRATYLLTLSQALNLTVAVMSVTMAALVGKSLAPSPAWATIPYGMQFAAVMLCTYPASMLMRRLGRRFGFFLGASFLIASGLIGYWGVTQSSFLGLMLAHILLGLYISFANFYRFAAVDGLESERKARAMSLVVSGGVAAALLGPLLAMLTRQVSGFTEFAPSYAALSVIGALTLCVLSVWRPNESTPAVATQKNTPLHWRQNHPALIAIAAAAGGYFVMSVLMVQVTLVMKELCSFNQMSFAIQGHILAMFVPSFFTGALIARIGTRHVLTLAFLLLVGSSALGSFSIDYWVTVAGLILLGLGWNFAYLGGGALLAQRVPEHERHTWQGINDTVIAAFAAAGVFLSAPLLTWLGWYGSNMLCMGVSVLLAALCWAALRQR